MRYEQQKLPLLGEVPGPVDLPMALIENCDSKEDAIRLCWAMRRRVDGKRLTIEEAGKQLGLSRPQMSKILSGDSGLRGCHERALQYLCGNRAIAQYQAWELGCHLVDDTWEEHNARRAKEAA